MRCFRSPMAVDNHSLQEVLICLSYCVSADWYSLYSGRGLSTLNSEPSDNTHEITWEKWSHRFCVSDMRRSHPIRVTLLYSSQTYTNFSFSKLYTTSINVDRSLIYAEWPLLPEQRIGRVAYVRWSVIMTHQRASTSNGPPSTGTKARHGMSGTSCML
jgi:hypothetical protein